MASQFYSFKGVVAKVRSIIAETQAQNPVERFIFLSDEFRLPMNCQRTRGQASEVNNKE